jgi:putative transposase
LPKDNGDRQIANVPINLLDRQFAAEQPNQKWIADFTYVWTAEGWLYVSAVIDLYSRKLSELRRAAFSTLAAAKSA